MDIEPNKNEHRVIFVSAGLPSFGSEYLEIMEMQRESMRSNQIYIASQEELIHPFEKMESAFDPPPAKTLEDYYKEVTLYQIKNSIAPKSGQENRRERRKKNRRKK